MIKLRFDRKRFIKKMFCSLQNVAEHLFIFDLIKTKGNHLFSGSNHDRIPDKRG